MAKVPVSVKLNRKIVRAFKVFDHGDEGRVDVREVGTILRSLGCHLTEDELRDVLNEMENEDSTEKVTEGRFVPVATKILIERRFQGASDEILMKAFKVLDMEEKGYITDKELTECLSKEGEPFSKDEMDEMISFAVDEETGKMDYAKYVDAISKESNNF